MGGGGHYTCLMRVCDDVFDSCHLTFSQSPKNAVFRLLSTHFYTGIFLLRKTFTRLRVGRGFLQAWYLAVQSTNNKLHVFVLICHVIASNSWQLVLVLFVHCKGLMLFSCPVANCNFAIILDISVFRKESGTITPWKEAFWHLKTNLIVAAVQNFCMMKMGGHFWHKVAGKIWNFHNFCAESAYF